MRPHVNGSFDDPLIPLELTKAKIPRNFKPFQRRDSFTAGGFSGNIRREEKALLMCCKKVFGSLAPEIAMKWHVLDNQRKIMGVLQKQVSNKTEIRVRVKGAKRPFISKLLKIVEAETLVELENLEIDTKAQLIIEKLEPARGDDLIQSFPDVIMEFLVNENFCQCAVRNFGVSNIPPHFGFILSFPETLEIQEKRREKRTRYEEPEMVSVEFRLPIGDEKDRKFTLNVFDHSKRGFGLLVRQKDFDLLKVLQRGDKLENMTFYSESLMMRIDATVRHKTKIEEGKYQGCYILGIELPERVKD